MPDIGWFELLILMVLAIVVVGPRDLPRLMRTLGRWGAQARAMAREFQDSFEEMGRQIDFEETRKEIEAMTRRGLDPAPRSKVEDGEPEDEEPEDEDGPPAPPQAVSSKLVPDTEPAAPLDEPERKAGP